MSRRFSLFTGWTLFALAFGLILSAAAVWMLAVRPGQALAAPTQAADAALETTTVERGELVLEASGSGSLAASNTTDLAFAADGQVETLNVQVGDFVRAGQVLASLADIDQLRAAVDTAEINLKVAESTLDAVLNGGDAALAQALEDLSQAEAAYTGAQQGLRTSSTGRCEKSVTQNYWRTYFYAVKEAVFWEEERDNPNTGYGLQYIQEHLRPIYERRDQAYINWKYCEGYSQQEILESEAAFQLAGAKRDQAQQKYDRLLAEAGVDRQQAALAQAGVYNATAQLESARARLEGATLAAPLDATVLAVNTSVGGAVKAGSVVITLSDLTKTIFKAEMDESDLLNFSAGCKAEVIFDSISSRVYTGTVTEVMPILSSTFGASTVEGYIALDSTQANPRKTLPLNLTGSVDITCDTGDSVLLVPVTALVSQNGGGYAVLVVDGSGKIETRPIQIGRRAALEVEVLSGLVEGERVVTLPDSTPVSE